jgi:hypothetical protein
MLLSLLLRRDRSDDDRQAFRLRGEGVSRIEGLSDTVFGFAITLLVVSLEVPKTSSDLLTLMSGFLPFVASFAVLFALWRAQFDYFRRYGLEDKKTVLLTGMLLIGVLFAIYPVKFLFTFLLLIVPRAMMNGTADSLRQVMPLADLPRILGLYGVGFCWVAGVFAMLYAHAETSRETLGLSELETFETHALGRRWRLRSAVGAATTLWALAVISTGQHLTARDNIFWAVYGGGCVAVIALSLSQIFLRRTIARERRALLLRSPAADDSLQVVER